jgi:hypothetical protein
MSPALRGHYVGCNPITVRLESLENRRRCRTAGEHTAELRANDDVIEAVVVIAPGGVDPLRNRGIHSAPTRLSGPRRKTATS